MRRFEIKRSKLEFTSHSGMALIGMCLREYTDLKKELDSCFSIRHGISNVDVVSSYVGLLCQGKSDYEAVESFRGESFFKAALGLRDVPSEATLRQRFDDRAVGFLPVVERAVVDFLIRSQSPVTALDSGHVSLDVDVYTMDNSNTVKEGVSWTYQKYYGFAPIAAYFGREGWNIGIELREGSTHSQCGTPAFLVRVIRDAKRVTNHPLLVRMDSGNDAVENIALFHQPETVVDFIIKRNWRRIDTSYLVELARETNNWTVLRPGKREALLSVTEVVTWEGRDYEVRSVIRVTERTMDATGQQLLTPEFEVEGWWTSLTLTEEKVIALYRDHATSEQYHSEFKTDLDIERLPSGKFATNALILQLAALAYNLLRLQGQLGLLGQIKPMRNPLKRRRIKTVIQELIYLAGMVVDSGRQLKLYFSRHCPVADIFKMLYLRFG